RAGRAPTTLTPTPGPANRQAPNGPPPVWPLRPPNPGGPPPPKPSRPTRTPSRALHSPMTAPPSCVRILSNGAGRRATTCPDATSQTASSLPSATARRPDPRRRNPSEVRIVEGGMGWVVARPSRESQTQNALSIHFGPGRRPIAVNQRPSGENAIGGPAGRLTRHS